MSRLVIPGPDRLRAASRLLRIRGQRRGAIGVASVIVLVVVQLLLVGAIIAGTREADTTMQRMDTLRAFYAAEGGMNMAIREMLSNLDEDGDGDIGTISNDALLTDDPAVGNAHVYVVQSVNGGTTTLVSRGRCGLARRQLTTDIE